MSNKLEKPFKDIEEFLKESGEEFNFDEDSLIFSFKKQLTEEKRSTIDISFFVSECSVTLQAVSALTIDKSKLAALSEFIIRANSDIEIGNFDLDLAAEKPFLSFKVNILLGVDEKVDEEYLDLAVQVVVGTVSSYWVGLLGILDDNLEPVKALDLCYEYDDDDDECDGDCCCCGHSHDCSDSEEDDDCCEDSESSVEENSEK
ncbi:MAG: hypothetical protein ACI38Q_00440 [Candidatus Bruticola sp.]